MFIITWKHCNYSIGLTEPKNVFTKPICWVAIIILSFILTDRLSGWPILFSNKHISSWLGLQASFLYCLMLLCSVTYLLPAAACIMFLPKLTFVLLYALFPSLLQRKWWFTVCSSVWVERYSSCYSLLGMLVNKLETMRYGLSALHRSIVEVHVLISKRFSDW